MTGDRALHRPRIAFVYLHCPHYRIRTFERLAERAAVDFFFFSAGNEWFWLPEHDLHGGDFPHEYLPGFDLLGTRICPALPARLLAGGYDVVIKCLNGRFALPAAYLSARLSGAAFVLFTEVWHRLETPVHRLMWPFQRGVYRGADAVLTVGPHVERYLVSEGVSADRVVAARYSVDNDRAAAHVPAERVAARRRRWGVPDGHPVILFLGRLVEEKGVLDLVAAFERCQGPDPWLVFVGSGHGEDQLRARVEASPLRERIRLAGYLPWTEAVEAYAAADLCVVPSRTTPRFKEPWGLVVNEAMNQAVPVVASEAVGAVAGGLLRDEREGLVVPEGDVAALAAALDRLLAAPALRRRLGAAGAARVRAYGDDAFVEDILRAADLGLRMRGARPA